MPEQAYYVGSRRAVQEFDSQPVPAGVAVPGHFDIAGIENHAAGFVGHIQRQTAIGPAVDRGIHPSAVHRAGHELRPVGKQAVGHQFAGFLRAGASIGFHRRAPFFRRALFDLCPVRLRLDLRERMAIKYVVF